MNAEEAVELGFADKITEEVAIAAKFDLGQFHNVPESASAAIDLAKNPPKVKFARGGLVGKRGPEIFAGVDLASKDGSVVVATVEAPDQEEPTEPTIVLPEDDSDELPRAPSLAITKMRQRIQKRGIARKGDNESQPAA